MSKRSDAAFNKRIDAAILRLQREAGLALTTVFASLLGDDPEMADSITPDFFESQLGHIGLHAWATVSNFCANDGSDDDDDRTDDPGPQTAPGPPGGEAITTPTTTTAPVLAEQPTKVPAGFVALFERRA